MAAQHTMASWEEPPLPRSFDSVFYGAAGTDAGGASDDEFNRVSFLSHFEGANNGVNNSFDDGSANNYTVTAAGNVTQGSFGPFARPNGEWGVSLDGTGDYLSIASSADFALGTGDFTVEFFVYHSALPSATTYFDYRSTSNQATLYLYLAGSSGAIQLYIAGTARAFTPPSMLGRWAHIAIARSSGTTKTFVDGTQYLSFSDSTDYIQGSTFTISKFFNGQENVNGAISNFRWIKGTAVYTSAFTAPTAPLTAVTNTKLLTCQSNRFVDNSASAHTVTPSGNAAISAFGPFLTDAVYDPAVNGASAYMDGSGDTLRATWTAADIINQNFTLEYWLYFQETSGYGTVSIGNNADNNASYVHLSYQSNGFVFSDDGQSSNTGPATSAGAISPNSWNHLALVRVSNDMFIYINGAKIATKAITASLFQGQSGEFGIGYIANPLQGYICDARVVTSAVYTGSTYTVPTAPLTAITNTKLLLNMADGQAIDSTAQNDFELVGNANVSTDQAKFGDTSFHVPANGDYLKMPGGTETGNFGTGNFTIEMWIYRTEADAVQPLVDSRTAAQAVDYHTQITSANKLNSRYGGQALTSVSVPVNEWVHIAVVRNNGTVTQYINGTGGGTYSSTATLTVTSSGLTLGGSSNDSGSIKGYIDDIRISKMARYTSNFTAPSAAFADKGQ